MDQPLEGRWRWRRVVSDWQEMPDGILCRTVEGGAAWERPAPRKNIRDQHDSADHDPPH